MTSIQALLQGTETAYERLLEDCNGCDNDKSNWLPKSRLMELLSMTDRFIDSLRSKMGYLKQSQEDFETDSESWSNIVSTSSTDNVFNVNLSGKNVLRDYQWTGVQWLLSLHASGLNG